MRTIATIFLTLIALTAFSQDRFKSLENEYNYIQVLNISNFPGNENKTTSKYIDGKAGLDTFLEKNVIYPEAARQENIEGIVVLYYDINTKGEITNISVSSKTPEILNNAVIDVLKNSGPWIPGTRDGNYIKMNITISYEFKNKKP